MIIFWNELKQMKVLIVSWSVSIAVLVIALLPVYISIGSGVSNTGDEQLNQMVSNNGFLQAVGMTADFLSRPIGMYGFVNAWFFCLACSVFAMHLGLLVNSKEATMKSADFIYTKPMARVRVYLAKLCAASTAVLIVGLTYFLTSYISLNLNLPNGFDIRLFVLMAFSLILLEIIYLSLGFLISTIQPKIKRPLLVAVTVVFITVVIGTFAATVGIEWLIFFAPPKYFGGSTIASKGGYDMKYVIWLAFLVIVFIGSGIYLIRKKDIKTL